TINTIICQPFVSGYTIELISRIIEVADAPIKTSEPNTVVTIPVRTNDLVSLKSCSGVIGTIMLRAVRGWPISIDAISSSTKPETAVGALDHVVDKFVFKNLRFKKAEALVFSIKYIQTPLCSYP